MATNSLIGKLENSDHNTVKYVYCHWDGYIDGGVGETLYKFYKKESDVDKLLDLGDISSLGEIPEDDPSLWKDNSGDNKKCITYRGRGDKSSSKTTTLERFPYESSYASYCYLFENGDWFVRGSEDDEWIPLENFFKFKKEVDDDYEVVKRKYEDLTEDEDPENIDKDYREDLSVGDKVVIKGLDENNPWEGLTGRIDWIDPDDFLDEFQTITVMVNFPVDGEFRKVLQNFDRRNVHKVIEESLKEAWGKYQDYDPKDGWTEEDITKHKEIDWAARNWEELDVGDEFKGDVHIYRYGGGNEIKEATFHKFLRPNPVYPPYYRPIDFKPDDLVGPMADGRKHGSYSIHDRYEDQKTYDTLSESKDKSSEEEKKTFSIKLDSKEYTKPEDLIKINNELDEKAKAGKLIPLRKEKDKLMLAEPEINGIWTIFLNDKGSITRITLW